MTNGPLHQIDYPPVDELAAFSRRYRVPLPDILRDIASLHALRHRPFLPAGRQSRSTWTTCARSCKRSSNWRTSASPTTTRTCVKAPKLHILDSGLVCNLLGIADPAQLRHHLFRGQIFESWVAAEIHKARAHRGLPPRLFHYRDVKGLAVGLIVEGAGGITAVEAKSGATVASDFLRPLERLAESAELARRVLVFGGEGSGRRQEATIVPWREVQSVDWR